MVNFARSALNIKLLRDLWRLRTQAGAIALVIAAGVGMVVMSVGMMRSFDATRTAYYDLYRFADIWAPLRRAPESLTAEARRIPGVATVESRISALTLLDMPGVAEPAQARVHSLPPSGEPGVNALVLRSGRLPDPRHPEEAVVSEQFATASRLVPGAVLHGTLYGREISLRVVGTVLSPEYVYAIAPGQIFPDNRRFGVIWMGRAPLAAAMNLTDSFNELVLRLAPGARQEEVIRRLDLMLAPYGGVGAYGRDQQMSDRFLSSEIDQLRTMADILPPIFLAVAAFLLNIVLARLVDTEREVIGLMKAFGFRDRTIMLHYAALAVLLSLGGLALGSLLGLWLGRDLAGLYQRFYVFPFLRVRAGADVFLIAAAATLAAVLLGAAGAVRRAARLAPAEAMRPPAPADFSRDWAAGASRLLGPDEPSRIILRGLFRRPLRTALTVTGLAAALGLYIASASAMDDIDRMIDLVFGRGQRADLVVAFAEPRDSRAVAELAHMPGVLRVEPFRSVSARLVAGTREGREGLSGIEPGNDLSRVITLDGSIVAPRPGGAVLSGMLARELAVRPGDTFLASVSEGQRPNLRIPVAAVIETPIGTSAWLDRHAVNRLLHEGETVSGADLAVDRLQLPQLYAQMKRTPMIAAVGSIDAMRQGIRDTIAENMSTRSLFDVGFAALVVLGIVYNSARITLSERARDLASLRVLGFRRGEVAFVLIGEQALLLLMSLPLGIAFGLGLSWYITKAFSMDLFTIPFAVQPATLAEGVLVVAAAGALTMLLIRGRIDRLDLVQALKTRE